MNEIKSQHPKFFGFKNPKEQAECCQPILYETNLQQNLLAEVKTRLRGEMAS